jgi:hypothetical protein
MKNESRHSLVPSAALLGLLLVLAGVPGAVSGVPAEDAAEGPAKPHSPPELVCGDPLVAGQYPEGCVSCHNGGGAETIGALLDAMGHPNVDRRTETVPDDCVSCHSEEGGHSLLWEFNHIIHYERPERNNFLREYGGNCLHCHALDASTGEVIVKSGPKNW